MCRLCMDLGGYTQLCWGTHGTTGTPSFYVRYETNLRTNYRGATKNIVSSCKRNTICIHTGVNSLSLLDTQINLSVICIETTSYEIHVLVPFPPTYSEPWQKLRGNFPLALMDTE